MNVTEVRDAALRCRDRGTRPRVHPNGFIQLDLSLRQRLHIWPDGSDIPRQDVITTVHDHRFDMKSLVLAGSIVQQVYNVTLDQEPTHEIYTAVATSPTETIQAATGVRVHVDRLFCATVVKAGETYTQSMYTFHDTTWIGLTATVITKPRQDLTHRPRILVPLGREPDNDFKRADVDEALLWNYIERALA